MHRCVSSRSPVLLREVSALFWPSFSSGLTECSARGADGFGRQAVLETARSDWGVGPLLFLHDGGQKASPPTALQAGELTGLTGEEAVGSVRPSPVSGRLCPWSGEWAGQAARRVLHRLQRRPWPQSSSSEPNILTPFPFLEHLLKKEYLQRICFLQQNTRNSWTWAPALFLPPGGTWTSLRQAHAAQQAPHPRCHCPGGWDPCGNRFSKLRCSEVRTFTKQSAYVSRSPRGHGRRETAAGPDFKLGLGPCAQTYREVCGK